MRMATACWSAADADMHGAMTWEDALSYVQALNEAEYLGYIKKMFTKKISYLILISSISIILAACGSSMDLTQDSTAEVSEGKTWQQKGETKSSKLRPAAIILIPSSIPIRDSATTTAN